MREIGSRTAAALVVGVLLMGCGNKAQPPAEDPTLTRGKGNVLSCRWEPVAPEWNEPCDHTNHGAKLEVVIREDNRPESAKKQTATCECH
jgi:hypothetical protein